MKAEYTLLLVILIPMLLFAKEKTILEKESPYHHIVVSENAGVRYLKFGNNIIQSAVYIDDPIGMKIEYTKYLTLPLLFKPDAQSLLTIGLGGGAVPRLLSEYLPQISTTAIEIDPAVVEIARQYFFIQDTPPYNIVVMDGRVFLMRNKSKYDIIVLDAYDADAIPFHLTTLEFIKILKSRLNPSGIAASNVWSSDVHLYNAMVKTYSEVFEYIYRFKVFGKNNVIIVAADVKLSRFDIIRKAASFQEQFGFPFDFVFCADQLDESEMSLEDVKVLTDDHAPVDYLKHLK